MRWYTLLPRRLAGAALAPLAGEVPGGVAPCVRANHPDDDRGDRDGFVRQRDRCGVNIERHVLGRSLRFRLGDVVLVVRPQRYEHDPSCPGRAVHGRSRHQSPRGLAGLATLASGKPAGYDAIRFWGPVGAGVALLTSLRPGRLRLSLHPSGSRPLAAAPHHGGASKKTVQPGWLVLFWLTWRQARRFCSGHGGFWLAHGTFDTHIRRNRLAGGDSIFGDALWRDRFRRRATRTVPLSRRPTAAAVSAVDRQGLRPPGHCATAATIMTMPACFVGMVNPDALPRAFVGMAVTAGPVLFLSMGLVYGFCVGVLCGLLFRSILASAVFSLFVSLSWRRFGCLPCWRAACTPGSRSARRFCCWLRRLCPCALGRGSIASWTTVKRLTPFVVLAALWIAGGLWYRV